METGTSDFITKPVKRFDLLMRVKILLRARHLQGEADRDLHYLNELGKANGEA